MSTFTIITSQNYLILLLALIFLSSPSFILLAAAANHCFGADDGGFNGILYNAVRDYIYMSQDCPADHNCTIALTTYGWPMNSWCVGNVTDMSDLFHYMGDFNEDISGWDISSVTNMEGMFYYAESFNSDISAWNTSSVTNMGNMFQYATSFNGDLSAWNTTSVTDMGRMFFEATSFNGDLSAWNTKSVISMTEMFEDATSFNQDLCAWRHAFPYNNADTIFMFSGCTYQDYPQEDQRGPFCASDCNGDISSAAITPKPASGAVYYFTAAISSLMILLGFYQ